MHIHPPRNSNDPFVRINYLFLEHYNATKIDAVSALGPVIILNEDKMSLYQGDSKITLECRPESFHILKSVIHSPLSLYFMVTNAQGEFISDEETLGHVQTLKARHVKGMDCWAEKEKLFSKETAKRQFVMMEKSLEFYNRILKSRKITSQDYRDFSVEMVPFYVANIRDAVKIEIDNLHRISLSWKEKLGKEWEKVHVIVLGVHMARHGYMPMQYFARLLKQPLGSWSSWTEADIDDRKLIYLEGLVPFNEDVALNLMGGVWTDTRLSEMIFGERLRLHMDGQGEHAKEYLDSLFPE